MIYNINSPKQKQSDKNTWEGMAYHPASRDRYATVDTIPEDWKLIDDQDVH